MSSFYNINQRFQNQNDETNNQFTPLQTFISFIIIGYFGIKIVYSTFFNYYPDKFYEKNIEITKEDNISTLSVYAPNNWNNEFVDFITLITLSFIIYLFTNFHQKSLITPNGVISITFLIGYILGLGYPIFKKVFSSQEDSNFSKYISSIFLIIIAIMVIVSNYSNENPSKDISIYLVTLFILLYGLYLTRKKSTSQIQTKVFNSKNNKCTSRSNGIIQTSGEKVHFSIPFFTFVILLLFKQDPSNDTFRLAIYFVFGILLGIFVSSISYFGIEYFLQKTPEKVCDDLNECQLKNIDYNNKTLYEIVKEYIQNVIRGKSDIESINTLKRAEDILEEEHVNELNVEQTNLNRIRKSSLQKVFEDNFKFVKKYSFVEKVKIIAFAIIFILIAYLIFISVYESFK
jgi:cytochrome c biogenesis factor